MWTVKNTLLVMIKQTSLPSTKKAEVRGSQHNQDHYINAHICTYAFLNLICMMF